MPGSILHLSSTTATAGDGDLYVLRDDETGSLGWLDAHPHGFVLNAARSPRPDYLILNGRAAARSRADRRAVRAAKLTGAKPSSQDLRHSFASYLITEARFDAHRVSRLLGHTSVAFTMTTYARLFEHATHADELRARMAETALAVLTD